MKIAVVGAGAMGSIYAGHLAEAGNDVWVIDLWRAHLDAIRHQGLRIEGPSGVRTVRCLQIAETTTRVGPCDLVIVATKASGVEGAARTLTPLLHDKTIVLTIQNGLGASERIGRVLPSATIMLGVAGGFGASVVGPGHVHHNAKELIRLGEQLGGISPRLEAITEVWRSAGFTVKAYADIHQLVWEKFICNVSFSGPCTIFGWRVGAVMENPSAWRVALGCGLEAFRVAVAKGVNLSFDDAETYIVTFGQSLPDAQPSMLQDHLARRRSEIDSLNGMVPVEAAHVGMTAPYNEVVTAIVRARESGF